MNNRPILVGRWTHAQQIVLLCQLAALLLLFDFLILL
jgi:hypothetical protein